MGIPINDAGRLRADSYDADRISIVSEYQCRPHGGDYSMRGLSNMRIDAVLDPVTQQLVAFHTRMGFQEMERTIWMDGRPHPGPLAPHTWQGFSTHFHPDHVGGNAALAPMIGAGASGPFGRVDGGAPLKIIAHENVLNRLTRRVPGQADVP